MKTVTINKQRIKIFEGKELIEKLGMSEEDKNLVLEYQRTFPELLQDDNIEGFVVNSRTLHRELGVGRDYSTWVKQRIEKYKFTKDVDFIEQNLIHQIGGIKIKHGGDRKSKDYLFTLEAAKSLAMIENNDKGNLVRRYFITMERTLRNYKEWNTSRGIEKEGYKHMMDELEKWVVRNDYDTKDFKVFAARESNMINIALTGLTAVGIRSYFSAKDEITRDHLTKECNEAINSLQEINSSLILNNLDFEMRKSIIEGTCRSKYGSLYLANK